MKTYKHIFFDLDHTLWDMDRNSRETIEEMYHHHQLEKLGVPAFDRFIAHYTEVNDFMWEQFRMGKIDKETLRFGRFEHTLQRFGILDQQALSRKLGDAYVAKAPEKTNLMPHTIEVLDYLSKKYTLHIITNGFAEVQGRKMKNSGINHYFDKLVISEEVGFKKPDPRIFEHALQAANANKNESMMIGDNLEVDVNGAKRFGMDQVWYNAKGMALTEEVTHHIDSLLHLKNIL